MAEILDALKFASNGGVYQNAFDNAQQQELARQQVAANVQRLQQEALQSAQLHPLMMENKRANTDFLNAEAAKMRQDPQIANSERMAKAAMEQQQAGMLNDYFALQKVKSMNGDAKAAAFSNIFPSLSDVTKRAFSNPDGTWQFNDQGINSALDAIERAHGNLSKSRTADVNANTRIQMEQERTSRALALQQLKGQTQAAHDAAMKEAKTPQSYQALAVKYKLQADQAQSPEEKNMWLERATEAHAKAFEMSTAAGQERKAGGVDLGQMGDIPTTPKPQPSTFGAGGKSIKQMRDEL